MVKKGMKSIRIANCSQSKHKCRMCGKIVHRFILMKDWTYKDGNKFFCGWSCYRKYCEKMGWLEPSKKMDEDLEKYNEELKRKEKIAEAKAAARILAMRKQQEQDYEK